MKSALPVWLASRPGLSSLGSPLPGGPWTTHLKQPSLQDIILFSVPHHTLPPPEISVLFCTGPVAGAYCIPKAGTLCVWSSPEA